MRFLLDANMPRSALAGLRRLGHTADRVRDLELGDATDAAIAAHARRTGAALVTRDLDFADVRQYPPAQHSGLVVLRLPVDTGADDVAGLLERFVRQTDLLAQLPGHLVILELDRVRFRPAVA